LGGIIELIQKGDISGKIAKDLFEIVYTEGGDPAEIVEARGMKQVTDTGAIETAVDEIIAANPAQVEKAKANPKLAGWFVGQVMKATGGKANPKAVNDIVSAKLGLSAIVRPRQRTPFSRENGFLRLLETLRDRGAFRYRPQHPDVRDQMHPLVVW
jgi:hypothetical protein